MNEIEKEIRTEPILKFDLSLLQEFSFIDFLVSVCYKETGVKFSVNFNGSKGYLDHIQIVSECQQSFDNVIRMCDYRLKNGNLKDKTVLVFHNSTTGVFLQIV